MWKLLTLLILALSSFVFSEKITSEYSTILPSLATYQTETGGFRLKNTESSSLEATYYALLLSSVYGLNDKINASETLKFVQNLENSDGGYAKTVGAPSDLESTRYAVLSLHHLNQARNPVTLSSYLQKLYEKDSHLFVLKAGDKGSLKATFYALQIFDLLPEDKFLSTHRVAILDELKKNIKDDSFIFSKETGSPSTINYFGIVSALKTGYTFSNLDAWAAKIRSRQLEDGGFGSIEATAHAIASLYLLQSQSQGKNFFEGLNNQKLLDFVRRSSNDLRSASFGHLIIFLSKGLETFDFSTSYEPAAGVVEDRIVQGAKVTPVLSIRGVGPVSGLKISTTISHLKETKNENLTYKDGVYRSVETFDTTNKLGPVSFLYNVAWNLPELGAVHFSHKDIKSIGYGITVASEASLDGKIIEPKAFVSVGTKFDFRVTLNTLSEKNILSGDFSVVFSVLDSSNLVVSQTVIQGKQNKDPLVFSYVLKSANIPAGALTFLFEVKVGDIAHTVKKVVYNLNIPMIASEISGGQNKYKLGDKVTFSMTPANFPDLRHVVPLSNKEGKRDFYLVVSSKSGSRLLTVPGEPKTEGSNTKYTFSLTVAKTFDLIGTNFVSFFYKPASGNEIELLNYDSAISDLYDESTLLNFTVAAELFMHAIKETPNKEDFFYGNDISFKFQVKDGLSNSLVVAGSNELANVYLSLRHTIKNRIVTSTNQTASHYLNSKGEPEGFLIKWTINPNAIRGPGLLTISAADSDGRPIVIYKDQNKKEEATYKVNIGGTIETKHKTFISTPEDESIFVVEFSLFCQGSSLKNAQLRSSVYYKSESQKDKLFDLPVAVDETGKYSVSWVAPKSKSISGDYSIELFREVDRSKSEEQSPVVTINVSHQAPSQPLPFRTEFFIVLLFVAAFLSASSQKQKYTTQ